MFCLYLDICVDMVSLLFKMFTVVKTEACKHWCLFLQCAYFFFFFLVFVSNTIQLVLKKTWIWIFWGFFAFAFIFNGVHSQTAERVSISHKGGIPQVAFPRSCPWIPASVASVRRPPGLEWVEILGTCPLHPDRTPQSAHDDVHGKDKRCKWM